VRVQRLRLPQPAVGSTALRQRADGSVCACIHSELLQATAASAHLRRQRILVRQQPVYEGQLALLRRLGLGLLRRQCRRQLRLGGGGLAGQAARQLRNLAPQRRRQRVALLQLALQLLQLGLRGVAAAPAGSAGAAGGWQCCLPSSPRRTPAAPP
jgi:hypothetical protein